jgi:hypothetical protein
MSTVHELKTWPRPYEAVRAGIKRFEWRLNDREYQSGDVLHLREYEPPGFIEMGKYTGRSLKARVTYVLSAGFGLPAGYCVLSLSEPFEVTP